MNNKINNKLQNNRFEEKSYFEKRQFTIARYCSCTKRRFVLVSFSFMSVYIYILLILFRFNFTRFTSIYTGIWKKKTSCILFFNVFVLFLFLFLFLFLIWFFFHFFFFFLKNKFISKIGKEALDQLIRNVERLIARNMSPTASKFESKNKNKKRREKKN